MRRSNTVGPEYYTSFATLAVLAGLVGACADDGADARGSGASTGGTVATGSAAPGGDGSGGSAPGPSSPLPTGGAGGALAGGAGGALAGGAGGALAGGTGPTPGGQTSLQLIQSKTLGWNLGNSLDAPEGETAWGNPTVTPELLQAVAAQGFDLVRIPVTWSLYTGPGPDFVIEPSWLARVDEVVGAALDAGLAVIINVHHDGADGYEDVEWLTLNDASGAVTDANNAAVRARFVAIWEQIATHFQGRDANLLFESMNEIHDGYVNPPADSPYHRIINDLNQAFVDTVRATGGNNSQRHLVVPGYNTNIDATLDGFVVPTDPTPDHLTLSVHYYDPYTFALTAETNTWGVDSAGTDNWGQEDHVTAQFDRLKATYVDRGMPVILGEYGAIQQDGFESSRRYYMEYVTKAAVDRGILPVYWDNGGKNTGSDGFALFDRDTNAVFRPIILEAMMRAATSDYTLDAIALP